MISKHIFTSDVISGKHMWINGLHSTGDLIVASTNFDIENNLKVGEDLSIGGNSVLSGNANISGDLYVGQNLTVKGTTTTLDTVNVTVDDHNIELGSVDNPTNITAEGGGITLKGDQDKTFNWQANYNGSWLSSENLGVADGKYVFTDKVRARDGAGLLLEDDGGNGIFIEDGGNVGIGTSSPGSALHVAGEMGVAPLGAGVHAGLRGAGADSRAILQLNGGLGGYIDFSKSGTDVKGRILYDNTDDYMEFYTNQTRRMIIDGLGNVGIGTTHPDHKLELKTPGGMYALSVVDDTASEQHLGGLFVNNNGATTDGLDLYLKQPGGSTKVRIASTPDMDHYFNNGGNVGIGTTSPRSELHIESNVANHDTTLKIENRSGDTGGTAIEFQGYRDVDNDHWVAKIVADHENTTAHSERLLGSKLGFYTNNGAEGFDSPRMIIDQNGNVGIGTTSPAAKLEVQLTDDTAYTDGVNSNSLKLRNLSQSPDSYSGIELTAGQTSQGGVNIARIYAIKESHLSTATSLAFTTRKSNETVSEKMRIDSNGNVGIGTFTPSRVLTINHVHPGIRFEDADGDPAHVTQVSSYYGTMYFDCDMANPVDTEGRTSGKGFVFRTDANTTESPSGNELVVINQNGNVGIGTTSPDHKLTVYTDATSGVELVGQDGGNQNSASSKIIFNGRDQNNGPFIQAINTSPYGVKRLGFFANRTASNYTTLPTESMSITNTGNVGIGTDNPDDKLHVNGDIVIGPSDFVAGDSVYSYIRPKYAGAAIKMGANNNTWDRNLHFGHHGNDGSFGNKVTILMASGNVGIGTTSPNHKLHIAGGTPSMKLEGSQPRIWLRETDQTDLNTLIRNNNSVFEIDTVSDADAYIQNRFAINHGNGNVRINDLLGIGKDPDGYHLDVAAPGASANGIRVQTNNASSNAIVHIGGGGSTDIKFKVDGSGSVTTAKDVTIGGDLTVNGTTTTVNSTTVTVDDKNIELGSVASPTNTTADGGGITLKGSTDKEFKWTNASNAWNSSEHLGVADGKYVFTDKVRARDSAGLFLEDDGGNGIFIKDGGNVGIGTTNPDVKLHIKGGGLNNTAIFESTDGTSSILFKDPFGTAEFGNRGDNAVIMPAGVEKMRITSAGNVGIGTTNPSAALDIRRPNAATNTPAIMMGKDPRNSHGNMIIQGQTVGVHHDESGLSTVPAGASRVIFGNGDWRVDRSANTAVGVARTWVTRLKILDNGNVGIGTGSPEEPLDVRGTIKTKNDSDSSEVKLVSSGGMPYINIQRGSSALGDWKIKAKGNGSQQVLTTSLGTSDLITVQADGNVGIGTDAPQEPLTIRGSGSSDYNAIRTSLGGTNENLYYTEWKAASGFKVHRASSSSGNLIIGIDTPPDDDHVEFTGTGGNIDFRTNSQGTYDSRLTITKDGNVGIGTTSPAAKLDLQTSGHPFYIRSGAGANDNLFLFENPTPGPQFRMYEKGTSNVAVKLSTHNDSYFNGGNVGIGTTSPSAKLDIVAGNNNQLRIDGSDASDTTIILDYNGGGSTNRTRIRNAAGELAFNVSNTLEAMRIASDGNVGIGTTSPSASFECQGLEQGVALFKSKSTTAGAKTFVSIESPSATSNGRTRIGADVDDMFFSTSNGASDPNSSVERMRIDSSGNVGIGTTSPSAKLEISKTEVNTYAGSMQSLNSGLTLSNTVDTDGELQSIGLQFALKTTGNNFIRHSWIGSVQDQPDTRYSSLIFGTDEGTSSQPNRTEKMRIKYNGNVGIGTTSPDGELHVNDGDSASQIFITSNDNSVAGLYLGDQTRSFRGGVIYNNSTDSLELWGYAATGFTAQRMTIDSNGVTTFNHVLQAHGGMTIATNEDNNTPELTLKRFSSTNASGSDDIVDIRVADGGLNFIINNDADADSGTYNFRKMVAGAEVAGEIDCGTITTHSIIRKAGDTNTYLEFHAADQFRVVTGGTERLEVTNTGISLRSNTGITGNLTITGNILHAGDSNTYFGFHNNDEWRVVAGGSERLEVTTAGSYLRGHTAITGGLTVSGDLTVTGTTITNDVEVVSTSNGVVFEGSATDDHEGTLKASTLTADRAYTLPNQSGTVAMTSDIKNSAITITAGNALTGGGTLNLNQSSAETITINHQDTSSQGSSNNTGRTYIQDISLDTYGHVTSIGTATETVVNTNTTYSTATSSTSGLVKIGYSENGKNYPVELSSGKMYVNVPWVNTDTNTTYSTATSSTSGLVKIGYSENGKNYPVELSSGKMYVNVPWVDTDTNTQRTDAEIRAAVGGSFPSFGTAQNGKVLKVISGNLSWQDDAAGAGATSPGGTNAQVQFNNNGSFGGSANLTFDGANLYAWQGDIVAYAASDKRLKNNISNISSPIEKIKQINGVNFEWSDKQSTYTGKDVGVIAQEVEKVLPEVVAEREDGHLAVKYEKIIPLLIEAIKDQQKEIEELKSKLS